MSNEAELENKQAVMSDSNKWIVCWKYRDGSADGHGNPIAKEDAEAGAKWANDNYPQIKHWIIQA